MYLEVIAVLHLMLMMASFFACVLYACVSSK